MSRPEKRKEMSRQNRVLTCDFDKEQQKTGRTSVDRSFVGTPELSSTSCLSPSIGKVQFFSI